jgi:hypothetical protein
VDVENEKTGFDDGNNSLNCKNRQLVMILVGIYTKLSLRKLT